jgi:hypothetical protein
METCTAETGLLRKKPCGQTATQKCLNCERPLCLSHAVAQTAAGGKKTGKYLCKECHAAWKEIGEIQPVQPIVKPAAKPAAAPGAPGAPAAAAAAKPAAPAAKPAAPAAVAKPAAKPEPAKPAEEKPAEKHADSGMIEFTPSKPPQK